MSIVIDESNPSRSPEDLEPPLNTLKLILQHMLDRDIVHPYGSGRAPGQHGIANVVPTGHL